MSQLRKEYKEFKQFQEDIFMEAAEAWTEENVILINERLNRNAIYRLNSTIERFDNKFGPYKDKLPAIADILNNAENGLHLVITGKVGSRTTAQMLQRMSIMYNILSNFFSGDLGALLKTPAFRVAHEQADEKIDKIVDRGHDVKAIRRTLASALKPNDQERMLFRRAYKSFDMPSLDWNMAAKQLCCLTCNELQDLAGIEKVPMVVSDIEDDGMNERKSGGYGSAASNTASTIAGTAVGLGVTASGAGISAIFDRIKSRSKQMTDALDKLEKLVRGVEGFDNVEKALGQLRQKSKTGANSKFDTSAGFRGLLKHPSVVVMKQAVMAAEAIEGILTAWNNHIKSTYKDGIKPEDLPKIKKELEKTVKGGPFEKIKGLVTGVKPFPGLSPDDIINAVMKVASEGVVEQKGAEAPAAATPSGVAPAAGAQESIIAESFNKRNQSLFEIHQMVSEMMLTEDYQDLEKLISQIGTFERSKEGSAETAVEKDLQTVAKSATTTTSTATPQQGTTGAAKDAEAEAAKENDIASEDIDTAIGAVARASEQEIGKDRLDALNKAIADLQIPNVNDATSASKFLITYKSLLVKDIEIGQLINILANNVQQPGNIQEQRKIAINIIKRIILEAGAGDPAVVAQRIVSVGGTPPAVAPASAPVDLTPNSLQQAVTNANTVEKNPQAVSVIDTQIKALEIPGITDVASVVKFVNDYISILGKMKEVKELLALLKDVSDVKKYPKVAAATDATPAASKPAA